MATLPADHGRWWRRGVDEAHERVLALVAELDELTGAAAPDVQRIACVRWKLSQASRERRAALDKLVLPPALTRGAPDRPAALRKLREEDAAAIAASAQHIAKWTMDRIVAVWAGYCRASAKMRESMRRRIDAERDLIDRLSGGAG